MWFAEEKAVGWGTDQLQKQIGDSISSSTEADLFDILFVSLLGEQNKKIREGILVKITYSKHK